MANIFADIFGGQAGKDAAAENTNRLTQLQTTGNNILDAGKAGSLAALGQGRTDLTNANTSANAAWDSAAGAYSPLSALAAKYGAGTSLYMDALGVNGAQGNQRATSAFEASPGYQWNVNQALDQTNRAAAPGSGGQLAGNTLTALSDRAQGLAKQDYGSWLSNLGGFMSPELSATSGAAGGLANVANARAGGAIGLGNGLSGLDTSTANLYSADANNRLGLAQGVTNGVNDQTTQGANAELAGAGNALKAGMGLATLAAGGLGGAGGLAALGGGTGLLGGSGSVFGPTNGNASYLAGGKWGLNF